MFLFLNEAISELLTSGTMSGTSGSILHFELLSITTAPLEATLGPNSLEMDPPAENKAMSTPEKS